MAYKTYDERNDGAWWLRLSIPHPGNNQPGMARVSVDRAANTAVVHARNLSRLTLDLAWMGKSSGAGKTMVFRLDDDISPDVFPIPDTTGTVTLELVGDWAQLSGYTVRLDGRTLISGTEYTIVGTSLIIPEVPVRGGHTLTVAFPFALPPNLAPNPGVEADAGGGFPVAWSAEVQEEARVVSFGMSWKHTAAVAPCASRTPLTTRSVAGWRGSRAR